MILPLEKFFKKEDNKFEHTIRLDGVRGFVHFVKNLGQEITISGFDDNHWRFNEKDRVLCITDDGEETRYQIKKIWRPMDPSDQYFLYCEFKPRKSRG